MNITISSRRVFWSAAYCESNTFFSFTASTYAWVPSFNWLNSVSNNSVRLLYSSSRACLRFANASNVPSNASASESAIILLASMVPSANDLCNSIASLSSAFILVCCSERNPVYLDVTPVNSCWSASISFCLSLVTPNNFCWVCNKPIRLCRLAFSFFSPSSSTLANSSLAAIRSSMVLASLSRICLCFSAMSSYFSTIPVYKMPKRSILYSAFASTSLLSNASVVAFLIVLNVFTTLSPTFLTTFTISLFFSIFSACSSRFSFSSLLMSFCILAASLVSFVNLL